MDFSAIQAVVAAIGSFLFITLFFGCLILICKKTKKQSHFHPHQTTRAVTGLPNRNTHLSITIDESASFDPSLSISMTELVAATKNFSAELIIGDGSFGLVYKAKLSNGVTVAIKKLDQDAFQGFREFRAEMETLGNLRHPNIVQILGYCVSGSDRLLIYEFIEKGSLDQWLQDASSSSSSTSSSSAVRLPLSWATRVKIVRGVANGLSYLHGLGKPIIHRDIKASNVLLDSQFEAHIADFGLARMIDASHSHVSTQVAGTMGYMPPEYREGLTGASPKADVYSFGILMLEIATGKRPNLPAVLDGKEVGLIQWARKMVGQNRHMEMVDGNIVREGLTEGNVKDYFDITTKCTSEVPRDRPTMAEVVELLNPMPFQNCTNIYNVPAN